MQSEMITKLLFLLPAIVLHPLYTIRLQDRFQKRIELQSEFLFMPKNRPCLAVSLSDLMGK